MIPLNKGKKSFLTAISAIFLTGINGLIGLFVTKLIIENYGSDFNGLNSTTTQFINMLMIVEGGFTLATNVALFEPLSKKKFDIVNNILSATKQTFMKIGSLFFIVGIIFSYFYSFLIKSNLSFSTIFLVLIMAVISTSFNLFYSAKYKILLQSEQKEYILNSIQIITIIISQVAILSIIYFDQNMLYIRLCVMLGAILNSVLVAVVCKKLYRYMDFNAKPDFTKIKGTKDVFAQKITTMMYQTMPILFISATAGTLVASVYMIYNNIFGLFKNILYSFINAPQMGFGRLINEKPKVYVKKIFFEYEFIVILLLSILLTTCYVLIIPFIKIFTVNMTDANYIDYTIATLMILITFLEIIHIPSGVIINMSANFKIAKKIQIIASIVLLLSMFLLNIFFSFYGILLGILLAALILALLEILYIHLVYFERSLMKFIWILGSNLALSVISIYGQTRLLKPIFSYSDFFEAGFFLVTLNTIFFVFSNLFFNKSEIKSVVLRALRIINKR